MFCIIFELQNNVTSKNKMKRNYITLEKASFEVDGNPHDHRRFKKI